MNNSFDFSTADKFKKIDRDLSVARFALIDTVIKSGQKMTYDEAASIISNLDMDGNGILEALIKLNIVGLNENRDICYLYPVSTELTGHRVKLSDGRAFNTMCAFDSLGCATTFGLDAEIFSFCKDTQTEVYIKVVQNEIVEAVPFFNLSVSYYDNWIEGAFNF